MKSDNHVILEIKTVILIKEFQWKDFMVLFKIGF